MNSSEKKLLQILQKLFVTQFPFSCSLSDKHQMPKSSSAANDRQSLYAAVSVAGVVNVINYIDV